MKGTLIRAVFMSFLLTLTAAPRVSAQVARAFLSGTGTDAGDCSNAGSPCRSLQYAVNQSAAAAEVVILSSGGYGGANITKSITVNAPAGVVAFVGRTISVAIAASDTVILRGLSMNGATFLDSYGIDMTSGGTLIVENTTISSFNTAGVHDSGAGTILIVYNCDIRRMGIGISVNPASAASATIENTRIEGNTYGLNASGGFASITIRNSVLTQCQTGLYSEGPDLNVENCVITHNTYGVAASDTAATVVARVSGSTITDNTHALLDSGAAASIVSYGNNRLGGNGNLTTFTATIPQQ